MRVVGRFFVVNSQDGSQDQSIEQRQIQAPQGRVLRRGAKLGEPERLAKAQDLPTPAGQHPQNSMIARGKQGELLLGSGAAGEGVQGELELVSAGVSLRQGEKR